MGELHFPIEQGDNLNDSDLPIDLSCDSSCIVPSNMLINDEEVGPLVYDAIESYDITSYDCVSPSHLIHSPPIERESTIDHPNFVNEECHSKSIWEREVDAIEIMLVFTKHLTS